MAQSGQRALWKLMNGLSRINRSSLFAKVDSILNLISVLILGGSISTYKHGYMQSG